MFRGRFFYVNSTKRENKMRKKSTLFIGLMLFSMLFRAGNLIFLPLLGVNAGTSYRPVIAGFIVTVVGPSFAVSYQ
jgi:LIVCS family branched-chain amino acid:cation transporter